MEIHFKAACVFEKKRKAYVKDLMVGMLTITCLHSSINYNNMLSGQNLPLAGS